MRRFIRNCLVASIALSAASYSGVVKTHGRLKILNHRVVDSLGTPIQLAGMSLYWSTFGTNQTWGANQLFNANVVATMANDWKSSLIRAPAGVYTGDNKNVYDYPGTMNLVKTVVDAAIANDIYVIVDWHLENGDPHLADATQFFTEMSQTYKNTPNIIWEIWNEPKNVGWSDIKSYANSIIPIIRNNKNSNLIIVGTPNWSHNPDLASADPITIDSNVAYAFHFYANMDGATTADAENNSARAAANTAINKIPLFITEWGTTGNSGDGDLNLKWSDDWLAWAKTNGVSWANWSLSNDGGASGALSSGDVNGGLSASGQYVKGKIQEVFAALPSGGDVVIDPPVPPDTVAIPGHIEAESYTSLSTDGIKSETNNGVTDLGYATNGSWAEYIAKVTRTGSYTLTARVASAASGTLTFKWNGATLGSLQVNNTGGWTSWQTQNLSLQFSYTGVGPLRVEWSGSGSSLVNLDWLDFTANTGGLTNGFSAAGFSACATAQGLSVSTPAGARELLVTDLQGRTLVRRSVAGQSQLQIGLGGQGLVLVRLTGVAGESVLPVLLSH
jgi:endoglucanase